MPGAGDVLHATLASSGNAVTGDATGARTARDATDTAGASNPDVESSLTANADQNQQLWGHRRFVSRPLAAQSFATADGNWTFSYARSESNLNHNQSVRCVVYGWRPSDGTSLFALNKGVLLQGTEPTSASAEQTESVTATWNASSLTIQDGDILVFDVTTIFTQGMSTAYTEQFAYDGTTEASATTCASFVTPPAALTLFAGGAAEVIPDVAHALIVT